MGKRWDGYRDALSKLLDFVADVFFELVKLFVPSTSSVMLAICGTGIVVSATVIASALPLIYGADLKVACGSKIIVVHFSDSCGQYLILAVGAYILNKDVFKAEYRRLRSHDCDVKRWEIVWLQLLKIYMPFHFGIAFYLLLLSLDKGASDWAFVADLPSLPSHLSDAGCKAVGHQ